jgi:DNA repair exonuclease SbcCD ATPase subunit
MAVIKDTSTKNKYEMDLTSEKINFQKQSIEEHRKHNDAEIEKKQKDITDSEEQVKKLNKDIVLIQKHIDVLNSKISDQMSMQKKSGKLVQLESKLESRLKKIEKEVGFYHDNSDCPTCKQGIEQEFREQQITTLNNTKVEVNDALTGIAKQIAETSDRIDAIQKIIQHIQSHNNEIVKHNSTITAVNNFIGKLQGEINELSNRKDNLEEENAKLKELKTELAALVAKQEELANEKQYYEFAGNLLKDTGIKTKIIRQYLPIMNKLINKYLTAMDFFVNFNINESFEETIKSRHRDEFSYANFSEGEKMRIDLALLFTWRQIAKLKNSTNTNLLILDEVFVSSLDGVGTEEFLKLIHEMGNDTNIFVISHKGDQLFDKFRSIIKFEKKNNFSQVAK